MNAMDIDATRQRFSRTLVLRLPSWVADDLIRAAARHATTQSAFARAALLDRLRGEGIVADPVAS